MRQNKKRERQLRAGKLSIPSVRARGDDDEARYETTTSDSITVQTDSAIPAINTRESGRPEGGLDRGQVSRTSTELHPRIRAIGDWPRFVIAVNSCIL